MASASQSKAHNPNDQRYKVHLRYKRNIVPEGQASQHCDRIVPGDRSEWSLKEAIEKYQLKLIRDSALKAPLTNVPGWLEKPTRQPILVNIILPSNAEVAESNRQAAEQNIEDTEPVRADQYIYALYSALTVEQSKTSVGSIALSLIKYLLGAQVFAFLTSAATENGYRIVNKTLDQAIADKLVPESFVDFAAGAPDTELDVSGCCYKGLLTFFCRFWSDLKSPQGIY